MSLLDVELDFFSFVQSSISGLLDRTVMDEDVLTAFAFDKSVAFVVVKPLHRADFGHRLPPCPQLGGRATSAAARGLHPHWCNVRAFASAYQIRARFTPIWRNPRDS